MTPLQQTALDRIRDLIAAETQPSIREIATILDVAVSYAHRLVEALIAQGYLEKDPGVVRGLRLAGTPDLRGVPTAVLTGELARRGVTLASLSPREPAAMRGQRTCAADSCGSAVVPGHLMCRPHWNALPSTLRERILRSNGARNQQAFERAVTEARDLIDSGNHRRIA